MTDKLFFQPLVILVFFLGFTMSHIGVKDAACKEGQEEIRFPIKLYELSGNTIFDDAALSNELQAFIGENKTSQDVERARSVLEKYYHVNGYPTVLVNIPEQSVENGTIRLEVIESTVRRVRVVGNRYFTMEKILKELPSMEQGQFLHLPNVQKELAAINRNPDMKVAPVLMPGKDLGTIDIELRVKDKLPLHGSMELNNRSTHATTDLRLNTSLRYDNLWQRDHSISLQYQTSPEDTKEVRAIAGSYVMPSPLFDNHMMALYGVISDSDTAFGQGFEVIGKGYILGLRNIIPLGARGNFRHNLTLGLDYKDFDEDLSFSEEGGESESTPVTYMPMTLSYGASLPDKWGSTSLNGSLNLAFRGVATKEEEFKDKRFKARGNYICMALGLDRVQQMPWDSSLFIRLDGQIADQPLISNEQYIAGGMKSVRGYMESEVAGDKAVHGMFEWRSPDMESLLGLWEPLDLSFYAFYDFANLRLIHPLPQEDASLFISGTGGGVRGKLSEYLIYEFVWGYALKATENTEKGDQQWYFEVKFQF